MKRLVSRILGRRPKQAPPISTAEALRYLGDVGVLALLQAGAGNELAADFPDLCNIHRLVTARKPRRVLEFGVGFSTIVIAHALRANDLANGTESVCYSVDANSTWIENTREKIGAALAPYVRLLHSRVKIHRWQGQICHLYESIPNLEPDFIYLDGPSPADVEGEINGVRFVCDDGRHRTVLAADVLLIEPLLRHGAFILVDGRRNNVRFLKNNLRRAYRHAWNSKMRFATFELVD